MRSRYQVTSGNKSPCFPYYPTQLPTFDFKYPVFISSATETQATLVKSHGGKDFCGRGVLGLKLEWVSLGEGLEEGALDRKWGACGWSWARLDPRSRRGPTSPAIYPSILADSKENTTAKDKLCTIPHQFCSHRRAISALKRVQKEKQQTNKRLGLLQLPLPRPQRPLPRSWAQRAGCQPALCLSPTPAPLLSRSQAA